MNPTVTETAMNAYDFDKTIYNGDSTADFYLFSLRRHPKILRLAPSLLKAFFRFYVRKQGTKTECKEIMYRFLRYCDVPADTADFWERNRHKLKDFYLQQKKSDDVIISASPEFLLQPICRELGVRQLIASVVNPRTGKYSGVNCHGEEKVRRFREQYPQATVDKFYSDSRSDTPMAKIAKKAYLVKKDSILPWNNQ